MLSWVHSEKLAISGSTRGKVTTLLETTGYAAKINRTLLSVHTRTHKHTHTHTHKGKQHIPLAALWGHREQACLLPGLVRFFTSLDSVQSSGWLLPTVRHDRTTTLYSVKADNGVALQVYTLDAAMDVCRGQVTVLSPLASTTKVFIPVTSAGAFQDTLRVTLSTASTDTIEAAEMHKWEHVKTIRY